MGISQIPDQIKRAPVEALRAVFSGIGRILLAADRPGQIPARPEPDAVVAPAASPAHARQLRAAPGQPATESRWRSLDQTGNVRLLAADEIYQDDVVEPANLPANGAAPASGSAALPLADYGNLSLASIRARLRTLSPGQLQDLADYERTNAARADVLGMLERRIEKLERGG
ncbi:MAG: hypothetical protein ACLQFR_22515 [Streptosporangiaceae bacterium]